MIASFILFRNQFKCATAWGFTSNIAFGMSMDFSFLTYIDYRRDALKYLLVFLYSLREHESKQLLIPWVKGEKNTMYTIELSHLEIRYKFYEVLNIHKLSFRILLFFFGFLQA